MYIHFIYRQIKKEVADFSLLCYIKTMKKAKNKRNKKKNAVCTKKQSKPKKKKQTAKTIGSVLKTHKKQILITSISLVVLLIILALSVFFAEKAKPALSITYIDLPESLSKAFSTIIEQNKEDSKQKIQEIFLTSYPKNEKELKALYKTDIIIAENGTMPSIIVPKLHEFEAKQTSNLPSTIRAIGQINSSQKALPLVLNHFEIAWNRKLVSSVESLSQAPRSIEKVLELGYKVKEENPKTWPLILAGKDDETLFAFIGVLLESFFGESTWKQIVQSTQEYPPELLIKAPGNEALEIVLKVLIEWRQTGFLHPEWFHMNKTDLEYFMEANMASFVMMFFSDHRAIPHKIIGSYESSFVPASIAMKEERSLTIPCYIAMQIEKQNKNSFAEKIFAAIYTDPGQKTLTNATSLAPVTSQADTSDKQASDVRLWAAASNKALPSFAKTLYTSAEERAALAQAIRDYVAQ